MYPGILRDSKTMCTLGGSYVGVELKFSVSRTNLGKKHTGLNPALLPRCFLSLYLPGNSSGFKKPSIQWEEVTPGRTRDFSSQHKPGQEAHRLDLGASAPLFTVPVLTRHHTSTISQAISGSDRSPGIHPGRAGVRCRPSTRLRSEP